MSEENTTSDDKLPVYDKVLKAMQVLGLPTVIVAALFYFLGCEVWPFFKSQLQESVTMQKAVTEAIQLQSSSQARDAASHEKVAEALGNTAKNVLVNGDAIKNTTVIMEKVLKLMEDASVMMRDTPEQRMEMIKLLQQIVDEQKKAAALLEKQANT